LNRIGDFVVFCMKCGADLPDDANFCNKCGQGVSRRGEYTKPNWEIQVEDALNNAARSIEVGFKVAKESIWESTKGFMGHRVHKNRVFTGELPEQKIEFSVDNINGPIKITTWEKEEYRVELEIVAGGTSIDGAERYMEQLRIDLMETIVEDQKRLNLIIEKPKETWRYYSVDIEVFLPLKAIVDLDLESSNGPISIFNVNGEKANIHTSNGNLTIEKTKYSTIKGKTSNGKINISNIDADIIDLKTSNGLIQGKLEGREVKLKTSNGRIFLNMPCEQSGIYQLCTSNGDIVARVARGEHIGYSVDLHTNLSNVNVDLPQLSYRRDRKNSKVTETMGYESKDVKIKIEANTSLGRIEVYD